MRFTKFTLTNSLATQLYCFVLWQFAIGFARVKTANGFKHNFFVKRVQFVTIVDDSRDMVYRNLHRGATWNYVSNLMKLLSVDGMFFGIGGIWKDRFVGFSTKPKYTKPQISNALCQLAVAGKVPVLAVLQWEHMRRIEPDFKDLAIQHLDAGSPKLDKLDWSKNDHSASSQVIYVGSPAIDSIPGFVRRYRSLRHTEHNIKTRHNLTTMHHHLDPVVSDDEEDRREVDDSEE